MGMAKGMRPANGKLGGFAPYSCCFACCAPQAICRGGGAGGARVGGGDQRVRGASSATFPCQRLPACYVQEKIG